MPGLLEAAASYDPDVTGGAALLGVRGLSVISHGSSSARAIVNAVDVAAECARRDVVARMREAVSGAR
jgi:glycerol-3-phosphate acyltransferase PlsX